MAKKTLNKLIEDAIMLLASNPEEMEYAIQSGDAELQTAFNSIIAPYQAKVYHHPKVYELSCDNKGNVFVKGKLREPVIDNGYKSINYMGKHYMAGRVILECITGTCQTLSLVVRYKDNDPMNLDPSNLEWMNRGEIKNYVDVDMVKDVKAFCRKYKKMSNTNLLRMINESGRLPRKIGMTFLKAVRNNEY